MTTRTALLTGASSTIGKAIALKLASEGINLALHYNNNNPLQTIEMIRANNGRCHSFQANLTTPGFETRLLDNVTNQFSHPDILINCAASQDVVAMARMSDADFNKMIHTNLGAVFSLSREFINRLSPKQAKQASIINISSIEAARPAPGHGHYAVAKSGVEMLTRAMALEFGATGLRVNAIAPGLITRPGIEDDWPEGVTRWNNACPLQKMGQPEDIANAVSFLASPQAAFISGTTITIDGGMSAVPGW